MLFKVFRYRTRSEDVGLVDLLMLVHFHLAVRRVHKLLLGRLNYLHWLRLVGLDKVAADPLGVLVVFVLDRVADTVSRAHHLSVAEAGAVRAINSTTFEVIHAGSRGTAQAMTALERGPEHITAGLSARRKRLLSWTNGAFNVLLGTLHGVRVKVLAEHVVGARDCLALEGLAHAHASHVVALLYGLFLLLALHSLQRL